MVPKSILPQLGQILAKSSEQIAIGYGEDQGTYIGPMISEHWRTRYHRFGRSLNSYGHTSLRYPENHTCEQRGFYVKPSIFQINWSNGSPMLDEEPPGPFLLLYEVNNNEEIVNLHNKVGFRRMTSVFTDPNRKNLSSFLQKLDTGAIFINQSPQEISAPIIGRGKSSNGVKMGVGMLRQLTMNKIVFEPKAE